MKKTSYIFLIVNFLLAGHFDTPAFNLNGSSNSLKSFPDPIKIMPLGNSITSGSGSSGKAGYRRELYLSLVNDGYIVDFIGSETTGDSTDFDRNHEGHGGWPAADDTLSETIHNHIYDWLTLNPPDIILLHIGTNDIGMFDSPQQIADDIEQILDEIDRWEINQDKNIDVILAQITSIVPITGNFGKKVDQLNIKIGELVSLRKSEGDKISLVDVKNALNYDTDMSDDNWHPNDSGYTKIADVWYNGLIELFLDTTEVPILEISPLEYFASFSSGETTFSIESNVEWNIGNENEWISTSSQNGSGDSIITVFYTANNDSNSREGNITISSDTLITTFTLTQSGQKYYSLMADVLPSEAGEIEGEGAYLEGNPATLIAHHNLGWEFVRWYENNSEVSQDSILTINEVDRPYSLIAIFSEISTNVNNDLNISDYSLSQNYPNPFNPTTTISYTIPNGLSSINSITNLIVYDVLGKEIITLVNKQQKPGNYSVQFDASSLPSGMYFYTLLSGDYMQTRKMLLLK